MKLLSAALAVVILFTFTGCGIIIINDPNNTETSVSDTAPISDTESGNITTHVSVYPTETNKPVKPVETESGRPIAETYLNELPDRDFGNLAVLITSTEITSLVPQNADNVIYNTRIERNQDVEQKYDTKIIGLESDYGTMYEKTYEAVKSGDFYTDILGIPAEGLGQFYTDGLLTNLNYIPFLDWSKPYFDSDAVKQMTFGKGTYGLIGDFNKNMDYYYTLYFNKSLIKEFGLENPYDLVYDDEWTIEKFRELTRALSDVDDVYGHGSSVTLERYIDIFFESTGEKYLTTGGGIVPEPRYNNTRTANLISKLRGILFDDGTVFEETYTSDTTLTAFYNGKILFYVDRVNAMGWFVDMQDDWGVLPFPKLDKTQLYNTYIHEAMPIICIPAGITNVNNTGLALQALNAASYGFINENYYTILQRDVVRDSDTLNMLDYVIGKNPKGRVTVDLAYMLGNAYGYIAEGTYKSVQSAVINNVTIDSMFNRHYNNIMSRNANAFKVN